MTRCILSFFVSGLVLLCGALVCWLQSENFERAARLDRLQMESEWHERECSLMRARLERFAFGAVEAETPAGRSVGRGGLEE